MPRKTKLEEATEALQAAQKTLADWDALNPDRIAKTKAAKEKAEAADVEKDKARHEVDALQTKLGREWGFYTAKGELAQQMIRKIEDQIGLSWKEAEKLNRSHWREHPYFDLAKRAFETKLKADPAYKAALARYSKSYERCRDLEREAMLLGSERERLVRQIESRKYDVSQAERYEQERLVKKDEQATISEDDKEIQKRRSLARKLIKDIVEGRTKLEV